jgi:hypothetical protein
MERGDGKPAEALREDVARIRLAALHLWGTPELPESYPGATLVLMKRPSRNNSMYFSNLSANIKTVLPPFPDAPRIVFRQHWHRKSHHYPRNQWLRRTVSGLLNQESDEWFCVPGLSKSQLDDAMRAGRLQVHPRALPPSKRLEWAARA